MPYIPWQDLRPADVEDLIAALLLRAVDGAQRIDGAGGDGGVDVVVRGPAGDHVFEIKSFCRRLTTAQKRQVLASLRTAVERQPDLTAWTLVLPLDPSPAEEAWFRQVLVPVTTVAVTWMGRTAVEAALAAHPELARAFRPRPPERWLVGRQLPPLVAGFTGRDHEREALSRILDPASPAVAVAVSGMAGVGKTALAVTAAHTAAGRGWFPGGVLFLDLRGYDDAPVSTARALDSLLRGLGVPGQDIPPETADRAGLYRSVLADAPGAVLVVLDNASAAEQVRSLLPGDPRHRVVVTSRHSLPQLGARLLELGVLAPPEAVALLDAAVRAADPADDRIARAPFGPQRVAAYCGHLPLALQIAAALLALDPGKPAAALAADLAEAHTRLDHLDDGERAVRAAFDLSYRRLPAGEARLFRLLSVHPGPDVATETAAVLADRDEPTTGRLLARLARAHLVEIAAVHGRWRTHDLLRVYAEQAPGDAAERAAARDRLCTHLLLLADAADDHLRALPGSPVPAAFAGRDDALAWFDRERAALVAVTAMAAAHGRDDIAHHLPARLVEYFTWQRILDDWLATAVTSVRAAARLRDPALEATALTNHGKVLNELRRYDEAAEACRAAVALADALDDRRIGAAALGNLGIALRHSGQLPEAISAGYQVLDAQRRLGDPRGEAFALNNLGNALQQAGRLAEAGEVHRAHLDLCRRAGDHAGEAMALALLGSLHERSGEPARAVAPYEQALAISRETDNWRLSSTLSHNLGHVLRLVGRAPEAAARHRQDLAICQEAHDLPGEARALVGLAAALLDCGDLDEALTTSRRAGEVARAAGHCDLEGAALAGVTNVLFARGDLDEGIVQSRQLVELSHRDAAAHRGAPAHYNLGCALDERGEPTQAVREYSEAASLYRAIGDRRGEARTLNARGAAFLRMAHAEQSERDHTKALAIARKLGDRVIEGRALAGLGGALMATRGVRAAIPVLRRAADVPTRNGDPKLASLALIALGSALLDTGRGDEAFALFTKAGELDPDLDPVDILYLGTRGRVRSVTQDLRQRSAAAAFAGDRPDQRRAGRSKPRKPRPGRR